MLKDGTVVAWGGNEAGQLGDGTTTGSDVPVPVSGISEVTAIAAGGLSSFALLKNGAVMAWGEDNTSGQPGAGNIPGPKTCGCSTTPGVVSGISEATAIAAGEATSLALLKDGTVMAWRARSGVVSNGMGELGDGTTTATESNVPVAVDGLSDVTAIAAGGRFNLAVGALAPYGPPKTETVAGSGTSYGSGDSSSLSLAGAPLVAPLGDGSRGTESKVLTRAQKLAKALKQCEKDRSKIKRAACAKRAREKYTAKAKKKSKQKRPVQT